MNHFVVCLKPIQYCKSTILQLGLPGGSDGKECACNAGEPGSITGLGRSPDEGNGIPFQCSCLENPMDREHGVAKELDMT